MRQTGLAAGALAGALLCLQGCNGWGTPRSASNYNKAWSQPNVMNESSRTTITAQERVAPLPEAGSAIQVPVPVKDLGSSGEDLYDMAEVNGWSNAQKIVNRLVASSEEVQGRTDIPAYLKTRMNADILALGKAVPMRDRLTVMTDANDLTWVSATMSAPFNPRVPADVALLSYWGRKIRMSATQKNMGALQRDAKSAWVVWKELRPKLLRQGGSGSTLGFDPVMSKLASSKSNIEYTLEANAMLDEAKHMRRIFER